MLVTNGNQRWIPAPGWSPGPSWTTLTPSGNARRVVTSDLHPHRASSLLVLKEERGRERGEGDRKRVREREREGEGDRKRVGERDRKSWRERESPPDSQH